MDSEEKILLFFSQNNQINALISEYNKLTSQHNVECKIIVFDPEIEHHLTEQNISFVSSEEYFTKDNSLFSAMEDARKIVNECYKIKNKDNVYLNDTIAHCGISKLEAAETSLISFILPPIIDKIKLVEKIINEEKPNKIVVFNKNDILSEVCSILGKHFNITIYINNSFSNTWQRIKKNLFKKKNIFIKNKKIILNIPFPSIFKYLKFIPFLINNIYWRNYNKKIEKQEKWQEINKKKILFFSTNNKQLDAITPVINSINNSNEAKALVIAPINNDSALEFNKNNISYKIFDGYYRFTKSLKIYKSYKNIIRKWNYYKKKIDYENQFLINDIPTGYFIEDILLNLFSPSSIKYFIRKIEITRNIIEVEKPAILIILTERQEENKLIGYSGGLCGIPTLAIYREAAADHPELGPIATDKVAVNGIFDKNNLINRGVNPGKIVITGCPRFDILYNKLNNIEEIKDRVYGCLSVNKNKDIIVFASSPTVLNVRKEDKITLLSSVFTTIKQFQDKELIVKLHPNEEDEYLHYKIASKVNIKNIKIIRDINLLDLLVSCDVLITAQSNVGIDAILAGKKLVIIYQNQNEPDTMPFLNSGIASYINKVEDIEPMLNNIFYNNEPSYLKEEASKRFIVENAHKFDGQSTNRVISLINSMIKNEYSFN